MRSADIFLDFGKPHRWAVVGAIQESPATHRGRLTLPGRFFVKRPYKIGKGIRNRKNFQLALDNFFWLCYANREISKN